MSGELFANGHPSTVTLPLHLTLYVTGTDTVRSLSAKRRLDALVRSLSAAVFVDVVDVLESPELAERAGVYATPTLVRDIPVPRLSVIGDLADGRAVAVALGLNHLHERIS